MEPNTEAIMVENLSLEAIKDHLPPNRDHQDLNKGKKPRDTAVFIGKLNAVGKLRVQDGTEELKLLFREVKPTGEMGSSVHMMCYDDAAVGVYEHLKPIRGDSWIMVWDVRERQYQGWDPDISHSLYMGIEGKVRIFYVPSPISTLPIRNIITIWQCNYAVNKRILFGVISEVIKHPEITTNGVYHTMFGVVDPTCLHPGASKKDLLLHVFMNERGTKKLRGTVERGQIIRTSNMMVEHYNNKYVAKVFSAKSVVRFSSACSEEFELITDYENYRVIDVEKAEITRLREWWASHHHELPPKAQQTDPSQQVAQPPRVQDTVRVEDSARVKDTNQPIKRTYPSPRGSSTPAKLSRPSTSGEVGNQR
ncbi:uncharacterized protein LOC121870203 isoform X2 [Homarus americanus]|uniref:uncharacterized protein LOC121870203 isoform X2 n=1 Tax=Homarus americanus TaxID=6706 RepID=UPI001C4644EE|nr:uncharacterized protein LOC121870203 isoform X2 [Homarus americanus]XP_042227904.1 uncharacterized protein LOC121870203 isoform X2 [Homarus americanus]XP_042227905.1 uncharacterized protein LOC121870203 isoform X2 [Homarus americanus]XP_042227906.1 uncharacterized protein LOC121870203 isoform X2 [Homarus americanus]